jgi:hypothetical protein
MPYIKLEKNISNEKINYLLKNGTTFVGAFSKTCPHCINMQSEWKKFISIVKEKKIKATILEIDSNILTSIKNPLINSNVEGFPSLFVVKNNKFIAHYNQERKANNFLQFLNKYVSKLPTKNTRKVRPKMRTHKSFLTIKNRYKSL